MAVLYQRGRTIAWRCAAPLHAAALRDMGLRIALSSSSHRQIRGVFPMDRAAFAKKLDELRAHRKSGAPKDMRSAFAADPDRFTNFSQTFDGFLLDWSKCAVTAETMKLLVALATIADVEGR